MESMHGVGFPKKPLSSFYDILDFYSHGIFNFIFWILAYFVLVYFENNISSYTIAVLFICYT